MSPRYFNASADIFLMNPDGSFTGSFLRNICGVRIVINLRADTTFNAGSDGTASNPYIVE